MRGYPLIYTVNSFLTDTSVRRTLLKDGHIWCWSLSLFSHFCCNYTLLYGMKIPQNGNAGALHDSKLQTLQHFVVFLQFAECILLRL